MSVCVFSCDMLSESVEEKSKSDVLYENRGTLIFYPLTFRLMPTSICDTNGRLADALPQHSIPHFCSIALRDVAPRVSISGNIRTISSVLRKYILHHSERFKHRSITADVCRLSSKTSSSGLLTGSRVDRSGNRLELQEIKKHTLHSR